ncbi:hypothetical protein [Psychrobacter sp.]|uniref:hypothetical protein n=1 Tax=Psychrobacter sp. TaxID=56811 RepID=UPI0025D82903|nr:hypothetical protein [Psychrobacter sp.]
MKTIDYQTLLKKHKPPGYISADANNIANDLIRDNCIQSGYGLNKFLGMSCCFDNYQCLGIWVQTKLDHHESYDINDIRSELQSELCNLLPQFGQG